MNLNEIKIAVNNGLIVKWSNDSYTIVSNKKGVLYIQHENGKMDNSGSCIGLTWLDGVTMNGNEDDFYIKK